MEHDPSFPATHQCGKPTVQAGTDGFCTREQGHAGNCVTVQAQRAEEDRAMANAEAQALDVLGIHVNPDTRQQMAVFARALRIYVERESVHGATWKEFDAQDSAHHCVHKSARMMSAVRGGPLADEVSAQMVQEAAIDSALDNIVYAGFFIRHLEGND